MDGRWGIFGGVFDPVHFGHLSLAINILQEAALEGILWVPSANSPHKNRQDATTFDQRVDMLIEALDPEPEMFVCQIEKEEDLSGYALHTVQAIKKRFPEVEFSFIIGADNIADITNWYHHEELLSEISLIAGTRPGHKAESGIKLVNDRTRYIELRPVEAASSDIRTAIQAGIPMEKLAHLVPEPVAEYIMTNRLYL